MARNETLIDRKPSAVFRVLADADSYEHWVVGSSDVWAEGDRWPARGSIFHHTQGAGPLKLVKDTTSVVAVQRPRRLVLEVRARPLMVARVELRLKGERGRTRVTMLERPIGGIFGLLRNPLLDRLIEVRNAESLRRLKRLAEAG